MTREISLSGSQPASSSWIVDLQELLSRLTGDKEPLPLSFFASAALSSPHTKYHIVGGNKEGTTDSYFTGVASGNNNVSSQRGNIPSATEENVASANNTTIDRPPEMEVLEHVQLDHLRVLERHAGRLQDLFENALRHVQQVRSDDVYQGRSGCQSVTSERYRWPYSDNDEVKGPRPDLPVFAGLFAGQQVEEQIRKGGLAEPISFVVLHVLIEARRELSVLQILRNILRYLRDKATYFKDTTRMLRFCSVYGLSGAITDVLYGKYGRLQSRSLLIDQLLPCVQPADDYHSSRSDHQQPPLNHDDGLIMWRQPRHLFLPAYAIAAVLGYTNVVGHLLKELGAKLNVPIRLGGGGEPIPDTLPALLLHWTIKTNQPHMVRFLTEECNFQFRWLAGELNAIFRLLFHIDRQQDEFGPWRDPTYDPHKFMYERDLQRKYRAECCFHRKQEMFCELIRAGLPRELFWPVITVELDHKLLHMIQAGEVGRQEPTKEEYFAFQSIMDHAERRARHFVGLAATEYNAHCSDVEDQLPLHLYYHKILQMWADQSAAQEVQLDMFEQLDPRWLKLRETGEKESAFQPWWVEEDLDGY